MTIRRCLVAAIAIAIFTGNAVGETASSIPPKFPIPFANSAPTTTAGGTPGGATYPLPTPSQIGTKCGAASLTDGFPFTTMQSVASGGCPPYGQDMNGVLKQATFWNQWQAMGGPVPFDSAFSSQIGGYPQGALVASATTFGNYWLSLVDNNTSNPDSGGANWQGIGPGVPTGSLMPFAGTAAPAGYFLANGQAVSRTTYAALFAVIGTTYGTGDGATTFNIPDMRGRVPAGNDVMAASAANRLTSAGSGCSGSVNGVGCGSQNEVIAQGNLPNVNFSFTLTAQPQTPTFTVGGSPATPIWGVSVQGLQGGGLSNAAIGAGAGGLTLSTSAVTGTVSSGGSNTPATTVQPTLIVSYIIKY